MKIKKNLKSVMIMIMVALSGWYLVSCGGDDDGIDKKELVNNGGENNDEGNNNGDNNGEDNNINVPQELLGAWGRTDEQRGYTVYYYNADGTGKIFYGVNTTDHTAQSVTDFTYSYNRQNSTLTIFGTTYTVAFKNGDTKMDWSINDQVVMTFYCYDGPLPASNIDAPQELFGAWKEADDYRPGYCFIYVFNANGTGKYYRGVNTSDNSAQDVEDFTYSYNRQKSTITLFGMEYNVAFLDSYSQMTISSNGSVVKTFYKYNGAIPTIGQAPSVPTGVTAIVNGSSVSVSWQSVSGATSYRIYRASSPYGSYTMIGTVYSTSSYKDNSPISGYNYYKVSAVNNYGESQQSSYAECNYTENIEPTTLSAPTNVRVANEGNNYIPDVIVRWDAVSGAKTYKVYKSSSANGSYSLMEEVDAYYHACTDPNPPTSGSRYYKVKAVNGSVESTYSNYAVYTPVNKDEAFAPSFTWGSCTVSGTNMTLRWTYDTGNQIGKPTKVTLRIYNPYAEEWQNTELSTTATSTTFNFSTKMDNDGWVKAGIIAENAAGSAIHLKVYNYYSKMWSGY